MALTGPNIKIPQEHFDNLSDRSKVCLANLDHFLSGLEQPDLDAYPSNKLAAVLVLLYEQQGILRVLLTTRSKELRTHAGQTALPGGKKDAADVDLTQTALREAREEVSLPMDSPYIFFLGNLEPYISLHKLLVTPVVAFLSKPDLIATLVPAQVEVSRIFSHPLRALLNPTLSISEDLVAIGSENWPHDTEFYCTSDAPVSWLGNTTYRVHRFRTSASPIKGLTADILIKVAEIAYSEQTAYSRYAPDQLYMISDLLDMLLEQPPFADTRQAIQ